MRRVVCLVVALVLGMAAGCTAAPSAQGGPGRPTGAAESRTATPSAAATRATAPPTPVASSACLSSVVIGVSARGRAFSACERGTPGGTALVVVGDIHGDEALGLRVVTRLRTLAVPDGVDLWLVPTVNPDGLAAGTRGNAGGVDENRNWPWDWQPSVPGTATYSGARAWSEPETSALGRWLVRLRPRTVVVLHSPLDAVDFSEGADPAVTRYLARASGYPARVLGARAGSLSGWFNSQAWGGTALTFEFGRTASTAQVNRVSDALLLLARWRVEH